MTGDGTADEPKDVLINADTGDLAGKWLPQLPDDHEAYWRVSGTPRQTEPGQTVWFAHDPAGIFAWGRITRLEDGRLWFDGARETDLPCLDDAPTRGFTYIDPLRDRLQDHFDQEAEA